MSKPCRNCGKAFVKHKPMQVVCGLSCALEYQVGKRKAKAEKARRRQYRADKERIKSLADHKRDTQTLVNKYIRLRDRDKPCVSCGQSPYQGQRHASHYRSRGAASQLSYNFLNIWSSCAQCNTMKSGAVVPYRVELVRRIGEERVLALEHNNDKAVFTVEYLKRLQKLMRRRIKHYSR